jgi:hypothetical protein
MEYITLISIWLFIATYYITELTGASYIIEIKMPQILIIYRLHPEIY